MTQAAELATIERPERPLPPMNAGGAIRAIVPQTLDDAYRIAKIVVAAGLAPKEMKSAEACMIAIMHGAEVGLPPMQALQSIAVINGRPSIWGDGAMGLVRGSGLLEWAEETTEGTTAICRLKRKGEPKPIEARFSDEDAKAAGLLGKAGPWTQYKRRMRQMRARSWALRDGFADVLRGLYIAEEAMDIEPMKDVTPTPPPAPETPPPATARQIDAQPAEQAPPPATPKTKATPEPKNLPDYPGTSDGEAFLKWADAVLAAVSPEMGIEALETLFNAEIEPKKDGLIPPDLEELAALYQRHERRLGAD